MLDSRNLLGWLLLGLLGAVGAGGAILGVAESPGTASLQTAITNTLNAPNYSEVYHESMGTASQTGYLTYQAPDRVGGYVDVNQTHRTYIYINGNMEYQSVTVPNGQSTAHLVYYGQQSQTPVSDIDPTQRYLRIAQLARHPHQSGNTYSFTLTQGGETGSLSFTVSGQYVGQFTIRAQGTAVDVTVSQVGTAPAIGLPKGARVIAPPAPSPVG